MKFSFLNPGLTVKYSFLDLGWIVKCSYFNPGLSVKYSFLNPGLTVLPTISLKSSQVSTYSLLRLFKVENIVSFFCLISLNCFFPSTTFFLWAASFEGQIFCLLRWYSNFLNKGCDHETRAKHCHNWKKLVLSRAQVLVGRNRTRLVRFLPSLI